MVLVLLTSYWGRAGRVFEAARQAAIHDTILGFPKVTVRLWESVA